MVQIERLAPGVPWQEAYPYVEELARQALAALAWDETLSTMELVETILPEAQARGDAILARKRIAKALLALAPRSMSDCAEKGNPRRLPRLGKMVTPWVWHLPNEATKNPTCPTCGQPIQKG